jgi:hypothetical protein
MTPSQWSLLTSREKFDIYAEELLEEAVRDGRIEDTGRTVIGETGKRLKVYRPVTKH